MNENEMIRLGIIGIGNMGSEHCRLILGGKCPEIHLAAVADPRPERRAWAEKTLPGAQVFRDGQALIDSGCCEAVLIAAPHYQHESLAVAALEAGLHVLCEKPAAVQADRAEKMIRAAEKAGKTLTFMFNQRTNCVYRAMKGLLDSGEMGAIKRMNWIITDWYRTQQYYDSGSWRATWAGEGGGVLLNQCPHQLSALLEFENGATGVFVASTGDLPGTNRLEIDCEKGKLVCEDGRVRVWRLEENEREICFTSDDPWYRGEPAVYDLETDGANPQHYGVINAFAAHLLRGEKLIAEKEDGLRALQLSNAIHLSGWTGRQVEIPADPAEFNKELEKRIQKSQVRKTRDLTYETDHS